MSGVGFPALAKVSSTSYEFGWLCFEFQRRLRVGL